MIIQNRAPELDRLARAMDIRWSEYRPWIDHSQHTIRALEDEAVTNDEDISPLIKAQYIHEMWWTHS